MRKANETTRKYKYERPLVNVEIMAMEYEILEGGGLPAGSVPRTVPKSDDDDIIDKDNPHGSSKSKGHNMWPVWDNDEEQKGFW